MSSQKSKQKKPYLKRGSRQFLSNAQVRSQSSKPKIVDFGADEQQYQIPSGPKMQVKSSQRMDNSDDDIKINAKPATLKSIPTPKPQAPKRNQRPPIDNKPSDLSANKGKRQTSIGKKKQAALSDYLDNQSGLQFNDYGNKRNSKPEVVQNSYKKIQQKKVQQTYKRPQQATSLKNTYLVQQQDQDQQQHQNFLQNDSFKPISNPNKNYNQPIKNAKPKTLIDRTSTSKIESKNVRIDSDQQKQQAQVNFVSDKSEDEEEQPRFGGKTNINRNLQHRKENVVENQPVVSKIKMNYFNKGNDKLKTSVGAATTDYSQQKIGTAKSITIADISKQLKQQIVKQIIAQKQQQLHQQLQKLRQKLSVVKKQKQKVQQQQKSLAKARLQFEKQMEQKNRQFQQKIKNQNSKLTRQKKYMKQAQMSNKGDWKAKAQLQDTKKLLEQQKEEKKKIQSKYKAEIENLRKKLAEQANKNKLLSEQVKLLQYGQIMHKQQMQQITKQQKRNSTQHRIGMWADVPQNTFLKRLMNEDFSLIEMDMEDYNYESNQYYQYYLKVKDDHSALQNQTTDQDRAKRWYKNGKIQQEYYQKFLKQIFPFNYTIVSLWNGDVKQILPQGIQIYYSKNSGVTQFSIKDQGIVKQIVYFPNNQTVQMTIKDENKPINNLSQVYSKGHLKRILYDGTSILQKKDNKGNIISMPSIN